MKDNIKLFSVEVKNLEKDYSTLDKTHVEGVELMKERVLELLANLKRNQDEPDNEKNEDLFEDLIYRVIIILGEL